jgi:hypothetical protein
MTNFIKKQHNCPVCDSGWIGDPIPYHQWDNHTPPYFYLKLIKIYDAEKINILEYECPGCRLRFPPDYDPKKCDIMEWNENRLKYLEFLEKNRCNDCSV